MCNLPHSNCCCCWTAAAAVRLWLGLLTLQSSLDYIKWVQQQHRRAASHTTSD